jgi:hypothetical protein
VSCAEIQSNFLSNNAHLFSSPDLSKSLSVASDDLEFHRQHQVPLPMSNTDVIMENSSIGSMAMDMGPIMHGGHNDMARNNSPLPPQQYHHYS